MTSYALWNHYMQCYDALTNVESYNRNIEDIASLATPCCGANILDAGSGTGTLSLLLKERGAHVTSLDFSEEALRHHRRKDPSATTMHASLEERLPLANGCFDFVCCASVLFALSRAGCINAVNEFFRVLQPSGKVIVSVAAPAKKNSTLFIKHVAQLFAHSKLGQRRLTALCDISRVARVIYYNYRLQQLPDWNGYHRFTEPELRELLESAGFSRVAIGRTYNESFFLAVGTKLKHV